MPHRLLAGRGLAAAAALGLVLFVGWQARAIRTDLAGIAQLLTRPTATEATINIRDASMISITKTWVSGGQTLTVTTTQGHGYLPGETIPGETTAAWKERHRLKVVEIQGEFPPD